MWLACAGPVHVAAQRVYLAVMDDVALRMGAFPRRRRIRRVTRVHERDRGVGHRVVEIAEEAAHLRGDEHAFVDDRPCAHRAYVEHLARKRGCHLRLLLDGASANVERALEVLAGIDVRGAPHEGLFDDGHAFECRRSQVMTIDGDITPEQKRDALGSATILEDAHACGHALLVRGQKEHGDAVFALVGKYAAAFLRLLAKEAMRHLDEYARAITRVGLEANTHRDVRD